MRAVLILVGLGLAATACAPVVRTHGYVATDEALQPIEANVDTKETIEGRMGTPSTTSVFENTWYYISSTREEFAYFKPLVTQRRITAIHFNDDDIVSEVEEYDVTDGNEVRLVGRQTPTRGRQLSLLEQIFGSVSAVGTNQIPGRTDQLPDSAGGPDPY